jgi:hypothetical protein
MTLRRSSSQVQVQDYLLVIVLKVTNVPTTWERTPRLLGLQMMQCVIVSWMEFVLKKILRQVVLHALSSVSLSRS